MRKKKKIAALKKEIKQVKSENDRLHKNMAELAEQAEQAESILREAWLNSGEEDEHFSKAGHMLYMAYMPFKSLDEFWVLGPTPYDHADPLVTVMAKRSATFFPKRIKRGAYAFEAYTDWKTAKDIPLEELACRLRESHVWNLGLLRELCRRAKILQEWQEAGCLSFERVADMAAKKLGVDIGIPDGLYQEIEEDYAQSKIRMLSRLIHGMEIPDDSFQETKED